MDEGGKPQLRELEGEVVNGRYRLIDVLSEGATGVVFRGLHLQMDRPVAVKVLRDDHRTTDVLRFRREAEIAARLDHPNCVHVYEFGKTERGMFIVMELLDGHPLADSLDSPRTVGQVLHIGASILEGLAHAHELGLFHRDIHPGCLLVTRGADGTERVIIADFGLAKVSEADPSSAAQFTMTGALDGESRYCAPEQALGLVVDARTDLFSVGMVLYRLLTGRVPYENEEHIEWLRQHIAKEVPKLPEGVPAPVAGLVYRLCKKERAQRYQSAREALADFALARRQCEAEGRIDDVVRPAPQVGVVHGSRLGSGVEAGHATTAAKGTVVSARGTRLARRSRWKPRALRRGRRMAEPTGGRSHSGRRVARSASGGQCQRASDPGARHRQ